MKKFFSLATAALLITNTIMAEGGDDADKKFRFGLKVTPTPTWLRSSESKSVENGGMKFGFGFGLQTEFRITSTAHFVTGIGGDFLGGKQTYKNGQGYLLTKDNTFTDSKETTWGKAPVDMHNSAGNSTFYELKSRSLKISYITLPILLKLMTKDISGFRYFGVFGGNIAIQTKFRVTDEITELVYNSTNDQFETAGNSSITDMRPSGDIVPVNVGLNVGLGLEYYFSGSTAIFFSANYCRGFINQYQTNSEIIVERIKDNLNDRTEPIRSKQSAMSDGVQINIGMLF